MPRVVGIDPGTVSFDILGLQDGDAFLERSVPTPEVARRPETLLGVLQAALPLDLIAGPSGYGLPLVPIEAVGERELKLICLAQPGEGAGVGGLRTLVRLLREAQLPVIFTPGVIHLPTVPVHRKVNRVDLGTAVAGLGPGPVHGRAGAGAAPVAHGGDVHMAVVGKFLLGHQPLTHAQSVRPLPPGSDWFTLALTGC